MNLNKNIILITIGCSLFFIALHAKAKEEIAIEAEMLAAPEEDEVETMKHLIFVTEHQLTVQKQLQNLMTDFKKQKDRFFKGDQSNKHSYKMVKTAGQILQVITDNHLQHLYSSEYLEELTLFSSIASKKALVRP